MASSKNSSHRLFHRETITGIRTSKRYAAVTAFIKKRPLTAFLVSLGILFILILLGSVINNLGKKETKPVQPVKSVKIYSIGTSPSVDLQGQIETNGVIQIVAQAPGIVASIPVQEGDTVTTGQTLVNLSSNYQGGDAPALQAQLAGAQYNNTVATYSNQKALIEDQRTIANTTSENTEQLRQISQKSLNDTRDLLNGTRNQYNALSTQIAQLEQSDPTNSTLGTLRQQQSQLQSALAQLQSTYNSLEYQTNPTNPPTQLSNTQKDLTLKQLDIQEKTLDLGKEVSRIQYNLALVQEGTMHPASPFNGTVERINVHVGQSINPGQTIATVSSNNVTSTAVVQAPREVAQSISRTEPSVFHIDGEDIDVMPSYVSTVATDGQLYSIIYNLPNTVGTEITSSQYLPVSIPISYASTNSVIPFIPIDSVYESQDESSVFVVENGKAVARKIILGQVYGDYVQVKNGLKNGDQIILDRTIVAGDKVTIDK